MPVPTGEPDAALLARLDPEERRFLAGLPEGRQASFAAGRAALRAALGDLGLPLAPLLPDGRGGPRLPPGALGSISHKRRLAVALAAPAPPEPPARWGSTSRRRGRSGSTSPGGC